MIQKSVTKSKFWNDINFEQWQIRMVLTVTIFSRPERSKVRSELTGDSALLMVKDKLLGSTMVRDGTAWSGDSIFILSEADVTGCSVVT